MAEIRTDPLAQRFGLPLSLLVPIAAAEINAIETYVGTVIETRFGRMGRLNALSVSPHHWPLERQPEVPLWQHANANEFQQRLHPPRQIWVHVDFHGYRAAYKRLEISPIKEGYFLDHVQNRVATRRRGYLHPYLRLCPVSSAVNTNGGAQRGAEGMERQFAAELESYSAGIREEVAKVASSAVIYADPADLTKMLDRAPGLGDLSGVSEMQQLFYAR